VDALSTQKSTYQTRTTSHLESLAKLPFIEPQPTQPSQILNSKSQHIAIGGTGSPPQASSTSVQTNRFALPTNTDSAVQLHPRPSSRHNSTATTSYTPPLAPVIVESAGGTSPLLKSTYATTRSDPRNSPLLLHRASNINLDAQPSLGEATFTRVKQRSGVQMMTDSSSDDDDGPENPVKHYHSGATITAPSSALKRGRKSSVHNLVDFYQSGLNPKVQSQSEIQSPKENAPASSIECFDETRKETTVNVGRSSLVPKVKAKRPQSMLVTSTSFSAGVVAESIQKEGHIPPVTSPKPREPVQPPFIGSPIRPLPEESASSEHSINHADPRRKPPGTRSLVALLEADSSKQTKPTISRGDSSPERAFRGVGDLIQRWQTLSQNKD